MKICGNIITTFLIVILITACGNSNEEHDPLTVEGNSSVRSQSILGDWKWTGGGTLGNASNITRGDLHIEANYLRMSITCWNGYATVSSSITLTDSAILIRQGSYVGGTCGALLQAGSKPYSISGNLLTIYTNGQTSNWTR